MEDLIGENINNFELQEIIGKGSMGIVYRAYHPQLQRYAAVKILRPEWVYQEGSYERFLQEARTASRLDHPHIVNVINFGEYEQSYYLMMDYIEGPSLRELLEENGQGLAVTDVAHIFTQISDVLGFAHEQNILHRDLKPDNILLTESSEEGRPYTAMVTDFGLVKIADNSLTNTKEGTTLGTPAYMSPEQCVGGTLDHRSDLYSYGVMLYETLTGQRPYPIRDLFDAVRFHTSGNFVPPRAHVPSIPLQLNALVRQLMSPAIEKRPESAQIVKEKLIKFLPDEMKPDLSSSQIIHRIQTKIHLTSRTKQTDFLSAGSRDTTKDVSKPLPYCIVVTYKGNVTRVYPPLVDGEKLTVGRLSSVDIILDSPERYVSKQHCQIEVKDGKVWVYDLKSTNGTYIGNLRLQAESLTEWKDDETINLGSFKLSLQYQGPKRMASQEIENSDQSTVIHNMFNVICEGGMPSRLPLLAKPIIIGRLPDCDMVLSNTRVSKRHCRIELLTNEAVEITDLNSTNGTFLHNRRLPPNQPIVWEVDTPLRVGDYHVYLER